MRVYLVSINGVWYAKSAETDYVVATGRDRDFVQTSATHKGYYFTY